MSKLMINICGKCGEEKPRYYSHGTRCRECTLAYQKAYRVNHVEEIKAYKEDWYVDNRQSAIKRAKDYVDQHKEARSKYMYDYYRDNMVNIKARSSEWQQTHGERVRIKNKRWRMNNPEKVSNYQSIRRQLISMGEGLYMGWKQEQYDEQKGLCRGCKKYFPIEIITIDHIISLAKGGPHEPSNCQLMCGRCNSSKNNRSMEFWKGIMTNE